MITPTWTIFEIIGAIIVVGVLIASFASSSSEGQAKEDTKPDPNINPFKVADPAYVPTEAHKICQSCQRIKTAEGWRPSSPSDPCAEYQLVTCTDCFTKECQDKAAERLKSGRWQPAPSEGRVSRVQNSIS